MFYFVIQDSRMKSLKWLSKTELVGNIGTAQGLI